MNWDPNYFEEQIDAWIISFKKMLASIKCWKLQNKNRASKGVRDSMMEKCGPGFADFYQYRIEKYFNIKYIKRKFSFGLSEQEKEREIDSILDGCPISFSYDNKTKIFKISRSKSFDFIHDKTINKRLKRYLIRIRKFLRNSHATTIFWIFPNCFSMELICIKKKLAPDIARSCFGSVSTAEGTVRIEPVSWAIPISILSLILSVTSILIKFF
jgi:hypothetical protein